MKLNAALALAAIVIIGLLIAVGQASARSIPSRFCEGVTEKGVKYEDFIDNPDMRISDHYRCRWKLRLHDAQNHICGASTIEKPTCGTR